MRVGDAQLDRVREHGWVVVEDFLDEKELALAREALWLHYPTPDVYFAAPQEHKRFARSQFSGLRVFPWESWDLNRLTFHPDLLDAIERLLATPEIELYKAELWAKYSGAVDYDQPHHRDYGNHSLVVPRTDGAYLQVTTFILLSDVTEFDAPTRLVPLQHSRDVPYVPRELQPGALAEHEVPATGRAGSLLIYRSDVLHRGSDFGAPGRARFALLADFQAKGADWAGKMAWPARALEDRWTELMVRCSPRERDLFGFPPPGHPYWCEQTLRDVAARYPGIDMRPYREGGPGEGTRSQASVAPQPPRSGGASS